MKTVQSVRHLAMIIGATTFLSLGLTLPAQADLSDNTKISKAVADEFVGAVSGLPRATGMKRLTDKLQRRYEKLLEKQAAHRAMVRECAARRWNRRQQEIAGCRAGESARKCHVKLMLRCTRGTRQHLLSAKKRFLDTVDREVGSIRKKVADIRVE